ncbi:hypothetical protein OAH18_02565 [bacterium]|nr:hypothetical protein [bacterium]
MQVAIKNFDVNMQVKSNGIEFEVRSPDGKTQLGDCYLTMTGLVWCSGKTSKKNGTKINWKDVITILESDESKKAAVKAAKQA